MCHLVAGCGLDRIPLGNSAVERVKLQEQNARKGEEHDPKPKVLQKQREFYFENGYIILQRLLSDEWITRLRHATEDMVDKSLGLVGRIAVS
jgi:alpha-amylase/alpha-mannosidase (GH57 family)